MWAQSASKVTEVLISDEFRQHSRVNVNRSFPWVWIDTARYVSVCEESSGRKTLINTTPGLFLLLAAGAVQAGSKSSAPPWISEGPYVESKSFALQLPLEVRAKKLYVEVELGGQARRFVFDTGSPSMIDATLASALGLEVVDVREGTDSHGTPVQSNIVQADLNLGGVQFKKVPLFAADFSASELSQCMIGDGVLGSEILPLCAWQIDLQASVLRCDTDLKRLAHVDRTLKQTLYDFGYPHTPILDVRFAKKAQSKAMFDTGSPAYFTVSPQDFQGSKGAGGVGATVAGYGSLGSSLGGQAPNKAQIQGVLNSLSIGTIDVGRVASVVRESPPSLVGASLLNYFVVTLDARSKSAYFDRYRDDAIDQSSFGFGLAPGVNGLQVSLVWEGSPASEAGLRAGQAVSSINGQKVTSSCADFRRVLNAMSAETIELEWDGGTAALSRRNPKGLAASGGD